MKKTLTPEQSMDRSVRRIRRHVTIARVAGMIFMLAMVASAFLVFAIVAFGIHH